jgi:hypothetical protein
MTDIELEEIQLSIEFGKRLMAYRKESINQMLSRTLGDTDKIRLHYEQDKKIIVTIINCLEQGEEVQHLPVFKKQLTIVGQLFFKDQFKELEQLINR